MGCCLGSEGSESPAEVDPLVSNNVPQRHFRQGRVAHAFGKHKKSKKILQFICASLCLWKPSGLGLVISFFLALVCVFQLVYDLFVICGCPGFDCGFLEKKLEDLKTKNTNGSSHHGSSFRKTSNTVYTLASIGGLFSYTLLLISLLLIKRRRKFDNKAIGPSDTLHDDLSNLQIQLIFSSQVILTVLFLSAVGMFYYLVRDQPKDGWYFYLMIAGVAAQFIAQWAAIVGCHVFAISSLALGTLADDTIRRIQQMDIKTPQQRRDQRVSETRSSERQTVDLEGKGTTVSVRSPTRTDEEPEQEPADNRTGRQERTTGLVDGSESEEETERTVRDDPEKIQEAQPIEYGSTSTLVSNLSPSSNKFDIALRYHEDLCTIVSDTVSAYCPWFVMHWVFYGATCLIGVIYISEEYTFSTNPLKLAYITVFLVTHIYMFLFPCCCAAYITDTCGGIYSRINKTTSEDWADGHPFKERAQLMMFTAYTKDRQCVFRIGRVTFTSTLAWISLLLGSTGLLFHFF